MVMVAVMVVAVAVAVVVVVWTVARLIFGGSHEVHRPVAGVIFMAVPAPVLRMTRRHVQVDRLQYGRSDDYRGGHRHDWLGVHHRRWCPVANHDMAIHAWNHLTGDVGADTDTLC